MEKILDLLLKAPKLKASQSTSALGLLLLAFGWATTEPSLTMEYKVISVVVIVVMAGAVHVSTVLSNADGSDAREAYDPKASKK